MKFRKKPIVIEAWQWFKNGDIPQDNSQPISPEDHSLSEGEIVRYFRNPTINRETNCSFCHNSFDKHGWVDTLEAGHRVCVGDWIIKGIKGEYYPCKPDIFEATYERVKEPTDAK